MAVTGASFADSLSSFEESTRSAITVLPTAISISPPENGISLLDAKNELFLSYLQNLALRNLDVIRSVRQYLPSKKRPTKATTAEADLQTDIVNNLVKQRVYLEKGVRPLEERLKYTIDKTLRAANEADRKTKEAAQVKEHGKEKKAQDDSDSGSDESDSDTSADESNENIRPAIANLKNKYSRPEGDNKDAERNGVYRPPRVTATSMPDFDKRKSQRERPQRSRTLDEFVSAELADGPAAEPSVGSMIAQGGRRQISAREREKEQERRDYEETHFTRLQESKKDKSTRRSRDGGFGGEDWRDLNGGLDDIGGLTRGKGGRSGGREGALEKSRKRRATEDAPRQDGTQGGLFDLRKKRMMKKLR